LWGFNSPFLGNWYRGGWGWNHFGGWFNPLGMGFFPTWGHAGLFGWGLGGWANDWLYSDFANPYFIAPVINTTVVANAPPVFVPDYSRPLNPTSIPPEPEGTEQDDSTFLAARDAFQSGEFARALSLTDLTLQHYPNDPILHEFRALCLFALGRYDEAAAALYVVLTAGPGWDWATMVGLYPDVDTYTRQLRALEAAITGNTSVASTRFVLAYHYMVQEHVERAREQFEYAAQLQPKDQLAAQFAKALAAPSGATAAAATDFARASDTAGIREPSPPPAALRGTWKARPMPDLSIELTLREDGKFTWDVTARGQAESITGDADYVDGVLTLAQAEAPALVGKIVDLGEKQFGFELLGGPHVATISFSRSPEE
jgi:tetratricopeptide (TPR) repeat protein